MRVVAIVLALVLGSCYASAQQVIVIAPVTNYAPDALGGIRTIIRYAVARPDRSEVDYLLLGRLADAATGALPIAIQVEGPHGDPVTLSDVEGADCTLAQTAIVRVNLDVLLIRAVRVDDVKQILAGSMSQPGPVEVQTYREHAGGDAGESSPVFTADGTSTRVEHLCSEAEVQRAIDATKRTIMKGSAGR